MALPLFVVGFASDPRIAGVLFAGAEGARISVDMGHGKLVDGVLFRAPTQEMIRAAAFWIGRSEGDLPHAEINIDGSFEQVMVADDRREMGYSVETLAQIAADVALIAAKPTPYNQPINWHGLAMRAESKQRAAEGSAPSHLRVEHSATDVVLDRRELPYARYFDNEDVYLRHRRFDGDMSGQIYRTVMRAADAVTVLPYDPKRDGVLLIEQFRPASWARGDRNPWVLEPIAGRCDQNESVESVAHREALEEAGLTLLGLVTPVDRN